MMTMGLRVTGTAVWLYEETGSGADLAWLGIIELGMRIPANLYGGALADEVATGGASLGGSGPRAHRHDRQRPGAEEEGAAAAAFIAPAAPAVSIFAMYISATRKHRYE